MLKTIVLGVCMLQHRKLVTAIEKARDTGKDENGFVQHCLHLLFSIGLLPFTIPRPDIRKS